MQTTIYRLLTFISVLLSCVSFLATGKCQQSIQGTITVTRTAVPLGSSIYITGQAVTTIASANLQRYYVLGDKAYYQAVLPASDVSAYGLFVQHANDGNDGLTSQFSLYPDGHYFSAGSPSMTTYVQLVWNTATNDFTCGCTPDYYDLFTYPNKPEEYRYGGTIFYRAYGGSGNLSGSASGKATIANTSATFVANETIVNTSQFRYDDPTLGSNVNVSTSASFTAVTSSANEISLMDINSNSKINADEIAWITGDNPPLMPRLVASVSNPSAGSTVKWKLQVQYGDDIINIPADGGFTPATPTSQAWNIYNDYINVQGSGIDELFGGKAVLTYQIDSKPAETIKFVIGGKNPSPTACRTYIDSISGGSAIAYAVAKHESANQCGVGSRYNQFYDQSSGLDGSDPLRQIGFPVRERPKQGMPERDHPGFGIYQLTKDPYPTRDQMWSWQANAAEGIRRLSEHRPAPGLASTAFDEAARLMKELRLTFPDAEPMPVVKRQVQGGIVRVISALDATVLTAYNGFGGCPLVRVKKGQNRASMRLSCWSYDDTAKAGQRWLFHANQENYVYKIFKQLE